MYLLGNEDEVHFTVNGHLYKQAYYLGDGIYPDWPTIVKAPRDRQTPAAKLFASAQEGARKDIERAFGVIQIRFGITRMPCRMWYLVDMHSAMMCCLVLHNMIIQDRGSLDPIIEGYTSQTRIVPKLVDPVVQNTLMVYLQNTLLLRNSNVHQELQRDLTLDLWLKEAGE